MPYPTLVEPDHAAHLSGGRIDGRCQGRGISVLQGECEVSNDPAILFTTILGSCISACIRDAGSGYGGMNHFLLPEASAGDAGTPLRYGAYAMEALINRVLTFGGGSKNNLEVKVFGGANVSGTMAAIGDANAGFALEFLRKEKFAILSQDLGGTMPRRIVYHPASGKAFVRYVEDGFGLLAADEQRVADQGAVRLESAGEIELF